MTWRGQGPAHGTALKLDGDLQGLWPGAGAGGLSFDVAEGRFFVLFGPSSVGKTTTLRTIAGLVSRMPAGDVRRRD